MKNTSSKARLWGVLTLLFLALAVWFGLPGRFRFAALGLAALILPLLLRPEWTFWIILSVLTGCGVALWTFTAAGYHYASILPLCSVALMLLFRFGSRGLRRLTGLALALALSVLLAAEAPILHAALSGGKSDAPYVIVLGAAVYGETPSISLRHRCDRAAAHLQNDPQATAVVSGGQGQGESISEAACMGRYLQDKGIDKSRILTEDRSTSTLENLTCSKQVIEATGGDPSRVAIVSSSYHLYRAKRMAAALGMEADGLPSSDGYLVYMTGMYIREAFAVWKLWLLGV